MIRLFAALAFAASIVAATPAAVAAQPAPTTSLYICIYRAGPAWKAGQPMSAQGLGPHGAYMKRLFEAGVLVAGGPMLDADGGLAIVRAGSPEAARAIFAADPALTAGVFVGDVHP